MKQVYQEQVPGHHPDRFIVRETDCVVVQVETILLNDSNQHIKTPVGKDADCV